MHIIVSDAHVRKCVAHGIVHVLQSDLLVIHSNSGGFNYA